jgi:hypothetical protein
MRLKWPVWGGRPSRRSRPRVAQAIRAARAAQVDPTAQVRPGWSARAMESEVSPLLLHATARVARASGRQPAEVWAEALQHWLAAYEPATGVSAVDTMRVVPDGRRVRAWQAIDATLGELRAS